MDRSGRSRSRYTPDRRSRGRRSRDGRSRGRRSRDRRSRDRRSRVQLSSDRPSRDRHRRGRPSRDRPSRGRRSRSHSRTLATPERQRSRSRNSVRVRRRYPAADLQTPKRSRDSEPFEAILSRLEALEGRPRDCISPASRGTEQIVEAIQSLKTVSSQHYYVSNFDPSIHDVDVWCAEVDRARDLNRWDDSECLSRIGNCLKGDAKSWLNEWVTDNRSWSNFKNDFKPLCIKRIDSAGILYEVLCTNSDKFNTYADYARKSLLRLRIVRGLSDDLVTEIVLRGINDPHVKATATNANLKPNDLVNFLSTFTKPVKATNDFRPSRPLMTNKNNDRFTSFKRNAKPMGPRCFLCGDLNHKQNDCPKKPKPGHTDNSIRKETKNDKATTSCAYCKKIGHDISSCFAKQRVDRQKNKNNVNFCTSATEGRNDVVVGVVQGIPVDILIDTGAIGVSLISSDVVKHFSCKYKPIESQIKGVGESIIKINSYVTLDIELDGVSLEVDLLVVPSECMNAPVIIGTDVLNRDGITYIRTKNSQRIVRVSGHKVVSAVESNEGRVVNTELVGDDLLKLTSILDKYSQYMISGTATTTVSTGSMHIRLSSDAPVYYRPYRMSHDEKLKVREIVNDLMSKGIVRESESPYSSPVLLVKKKDGSDRMCVDFRALNKITVKDRYPLPLIDDHIDRLGNGRFFTTLDMATGFHQIKLDEESVPLTGFVTPEGHFEYVKMPYGLANAPIVYQRLISHTLRKFIDEGKVLVYIDDCLIIHESIEEGLRTLNEVLATLTKAGFSINLKKCSFMCTKIEYLGRVISNGEVRPSRTKIQALANAPPPQNVKQIRQFLGLAGYFRKYIANYSAKTSCIARLTRKDVPFLWGPEQERVRQEIITYLTTEPVLAIFNPELPTEVHTDASSIGYGAVLLQVHKDGTKHVVAYYSQVTKGAEAKYHSYELETLAVVKALKHFRHYLIGIRFTVITDCNALKATQNKRDLLPRVARWWVYLQDFNFDIQYRKGAMLPHADYLSRNPCNAVNNIERPRNWAQIAQSGDDETIKLLRALDQGELDPSRYVKRNDILYYRHSCTDEEPRLLCYIPKGYRLSLLRIFHDEHGHVCADKTVDLILRHFWFPGLRAFVKKYTAHCLTCVAHKRVPRAPLQPITSWQKLDVPFDTLHTDVLGPLPESKSYKYVMVVVDAYTKYCLLTPIARQDLDELKRVFQIVFSLFGTPRMIVSDRGRMFESIGFTSWMQVLGIEVHHITPEMHHANGQVERYIRTVLNLLRIESNHRKREWADELWQLQLILNITKQRTTQTSALNLLIGHENATPAIRVLVRDVAIHPTNINREGRREMVRQRTAERLSKNQSDQDAYVNEGRSPPRVFQKGDLVYVIKYAQSRGKLDHGMRGPYRVVQVMPNGRYELRLVAGAYGKTTYAAAQFMVPWKGEWTPEACAAFFEGEQRCYVWLCDIALIIVRWITTRYLIDCASLWAASILSVLW
jgi:hypothetical protein